MSQPGIHIPINNEDIVFEKYSFEKLSAIERALAHLRLNQTILINPDSFGLSAGIENKHCSICLTRSMNSGEICYRISDGVNGKPSRAGVFYQEFGQPIRRVDKVANLYSGAKLILGEENITLPENLIEVISKPQMQIQLENSTRVFDSPYGKIIAHSDRGLGARTINQDTTLTLLDFNNTLWLNVIDGMGGYGAGEIAAKAVTEMFAKGMHNGDSFPKIVEQAGLKLERIALENDIHEMGACYATAAIYRDSLGRDMIRGGYQGDCQILILDLISNTYIIADYTTPDLHFHDLLATGMEPEDAIQDPRAYHVTNGLIVENKILHQNSYNRIQPFAPIELKEGSLAMLATDGVLRLFTPHQIAYLMSIARNTEEAAIFINKEAKRLAFDAGMQDNQSYILLKYSRNEKL